MKLKSKKGFALAYVMYFIIIAAITSVGVYSHACYLSKETAVRKPVSLRSYYAAIAAQRYVLILLKNPTAEPLSLQTAAFDGESVIRDITDSLRQPLGLKTNEHITVTITEKGPGNQIDTDSYEVRATFTS